MEPLDLKPPHFLETVADLLGRGHAVRFQADGWSMYPTIRYGETIIVEPLRKSPVRMGDVLLYRHSRSAIAHRLVRRISSVDGRTQLVLRGDAADGCDSPIDLQEVLGRVIAVERRGRTVRLGYLGRLWLPALAWVLRRRQLIRSIC